MSELTKRILFSIIFAPLFLMVVWLGGWFFKIMVVALGLLIQREMITMFRIAGYEVNASLCYISGLWVMLFFEIPHPLAIGFLLLVFLMISETFGSRTKYLESLSATLFCAVYAPFTLLSFILLREFGMETTGLALTLTLVIVIWGNDIAAYFGGRKFGKNPLAPDISPGKTKEGFWFGFIGGFAGLIAIFFLMPGYPLTFLTALPIVIIAGFFGPAGDLAESKIKRTAGIKDSSSLLPGHGGVFDRFDALLLASPAVYIYVELVMSYGL